MELAPHLKKDPKYIDWLLINLKLIHLGQIKWGKLYKRLSKDCSIIQFTWKDADIVLFISTVNSGIFITQKQGSAGTNVIYC